MKRDFWYPTIAEAALALGISAETVETLAESGAIPSIKVAVNAVPERRIPRPVLLRFKERAEKRGLLSDADFLRDAEAKQALTEADPQTRLTRRVLEFVAETGLSPADYIAAWKGNTIPRKNPQQDLLCRAAILDLAVSTRAAARQ